MSTLSVGPFAPARRLAALLLPLGCIVVAGLLAPDARAEYGDVVINNYSDAAGMRPVVFPHWFHRIRYRCKVCHVELGFRMRAGSNEVSMADIIDGRYNIHWLEQFLSRP